MEVNQTNILAVAVDILQAIGAPHASAVRVASSLLNADRRGAPTHGLSLLPLYHDMAAAGVINAQAEPAVTTMGECLACVDGQAAFGQLTGKRAVEQGLELVQNHGIAAVGIVDGTHLGRLGEWAERACQAGAAFIAFGNTGGGALTVAGAKGPRRVLAPNPIAFGIPSCNAHTDSVIVDFATSQVSGSRIRELANAGARLNPDWVVAADNSPTDDPQAFLNGIAALRPLGGASAGHKGFGLMVAAEMLSALAGGLMAGEKVVPWFSNGGLFILLDISRFVSPADWSTRAEAFAQYVDSCGYRLPGSGRHGGTDDNLDMPEHTLGAILGLARELRVDTRGLSAPTLKAPVTRSW